ncbi:MAG: PEP-CTERM sorting domain-containing protein [Thermoguttaceae bacterium]|jgi:hypothetical protein
MFDNKMLRGPEVTSGSLPEGWKVSSKVLIRRALYAAVLALIGIWGLEGLPAMGSSLNLTTQPPDLSAGYLNVTYDATTGIINAQGWPTSFTLSDNPTPDSVSIVGGQYDLTAKVTPTGQPVSGSLDVTGTIPGLALSSGTLLTAQVSQFGFQSGGGDIFEFVFNVTGGDLAPYYHGKTNVILDAWNSGFDGSFANNFAASPYLSVADTSAVAVPEPSTALLLLSVLALGLPALICRRRHASAVK